MFFNNLEEQENPKASNTKILSSTRYTNLKPKSQIDQLHEQYPCA